MKLFVGILPFYKIRQSFYGQGWVIWCHSKFYHIPFFSLTDCEWLYKIQLKTRRGYSFAPFWCLCQKLSLSPLYFNKTLLHKSSEQSSLISGPGLNSFPLEAKNPSSYHSATTFHTLHLSWNDGNFPHLTPQTFSQL